MIETITIENRTLEVYHKAINLGINEAYQYVILNGKIYRKTGSSGAGKLIKYKLEKESTDESIWIGVDDIKNMKYVITNTGYMKI